MKPDFTFINLNDISGDYLANSVIFNNKKYSVQEMCKRNNVSEILYRFGTWAVTSYGLESLTYPYTIEKENLFKTYGKNPTLDWNHHMSEKNWVDWHDFNLAFAMAKEHYAELKP